MKILLILIKAFITLFVTAFTLGAIVLWYQTYLVGSYYMHSGLFLAILVGASPLFLIAIASVAMYTVLSFNLKDVSE